MGKKRKATNQRPDLEDQQTFDENHQEQQQSSSNDVISSLDNQDEEPERVTLDENYKDRETDPKAIEFLGAVSDGDENAIQKLLENGADIHCTDDAGYVCFVRHVFFFY